MAHRQIPDAILEFLAHRAGQSLGPASPAQITAQVQFPRPTVTRHLRALGAAGQIVREGTGPATVYRHNQPVPVASIAVELPTPATMWSSDSQDLRAELAAPLGKRKPISYQRQFVDDYRPNQSSLLPAGLAPSVLAEGELPRQQPHRTHRGTVPQQSLIDP